MTLVALSGWGKNEDKQKTKEAGFDQRPYRRGEVADYRLAIACADDPDVNRAVFDDGEAAGVWVNAADDPAHCSFTLPARVRRGRLLLTVSTGGHSPALSSWLGSRLAEEFGPEYDVLLDLLSEQRDVLRAEGRSTESANWRSVLDSGIVDLVRAGRLDEARERLRASLALDVTRATSTGLGDRQG